MNLDEIEKESSRIYTILKVENLFKKTDFNERYLPQLTRNMIQFRNMYRKLLIAENKLLPKYLKWYDENFSEFPMNESDFLLEILTLLCNHGLATFELFKRFFLNTINLELLNSKSNMNLNQRSMLGEIIKAIKKLEFIAPKKLDMVVDTEFRNTLAHDSWYLEGNQFKFKDTNGTDRYLSLEELHENIRKIMMAYKVISSKYGEDYEPESIEAYKNQYKKYMDNIIPLSPHNNPQDSVSRPSQ